MKVMQVCNWSRQMGQLCSAVKGRSTSYFRIKLLSVFRIRIQGSSVSGTRGLTKGKNVKNRNTILLFSDFYNTDFYSILSFKRLLQKKSNNYEVILNFVQIVLRRWIQGPSGSRLRFFAGSESDEYGSDPMWDPTIYTHVRPQCRVGR